MKINEQSPTQWRMPREVTEKSSYLNRTGSVFYIGRHCEDFFYWLSNLGRCCSSIVKKATPVINRCVDRKSILDRVLVL